MNDYKISKKEMKEYDNQVKRRAKKFRLKSKDAHNLYDLYWMANSPFETKKGLRQTLKLNKMDKWFYNFTRRIEKIVQGKNIALTKRWNNKND